MEESGEPVVTLVSKDMVLPANPTHRHNYFLSCFDILWKDIHYNQRLIFYESTSGLRREGVSGPVSGQEGGADHGREVMEKLKSSLALCLVHYYPWCGRLAYGEPNRRLVVDCNDAGVEFVEAYVDLPMSLLSKQGFQMKPFYEKLCQQVDHTGDCLYSSPLLSIKATLFSDGGLALGITQSHVVADGQAIWNFMVSWGECARGVPLSAPPEHNGELLAVPDPSPEKANWHFISKMEEDDITEEEEEKQTVDDNSTQNHGDGIGTASLLPEDQVRSDASVNVDGTASLSTELINPSATVGTDPSATEASSHHPAPLVPCVLTVPSSAVKQLKIESGGSHTSYEVICAHFWQRLTVARQRPLTEPTSMFVLANCRSRVKPPVPPSYFGNAICFTAAVTKVGKICSESLHATANRIHKAVLEILQDSLVGYMNWLEIHDHNLVEAIIPKFPKGKAINVASSPRFPVYEVDFGWGKPGAVRSGRVPQEGEIVFFGGNPRSPPGDVEICMALPRDVLKLLLEDPMFLATTPCSPFDT